MIVAAAVVRSVGLATFRQHPTSETAPAAVALESFVDAGQPAYLPYSWQRYGAPSFGWRPSSPVAAAAALAMERFVFAAFAFAAAAVAGLAAFVADWLAPAS